MIDYKQEAGQKHRLIINSDATREAGRSSGGVSCGALRANCLARRVAEQPLLLAGFVETSNLLTSSCPSNNWAAKDAETTVVGNADIKSSAPLSPDRWAGRAQI